MLYVLYVVKKFLPQDVKKKEKHKRRPQEGQVIFEVNLIYFPPCNGLAGRIVCQNFDFDINFEEDKDRPRRTAAQENHLEFLEVYVSG